MSLEVNVKMSLDILNNNFVFGQVEMVPLEGKKSLKVPGYDKMVEFGTLTSFAYPVVGNGKYILFNIPFK